MSGTPDPQQPEQAAPKADPLATASPPLGIEFPTSPLSEPPSGLAPSPGLSPSPGIQAPKFDAPPAQEPQETFAPMEPVNFQSEAAPNVQAEPFPAAQPFPQAEPFPQAQPFETPQPFLTQPAVATPPNKRGLSGGAIAGIVAGSVALILLFIGGGSLLSPIFSSSSADNIFFEDGTDVLDGDEFDSAGYDDSLPTPPEIVEDYLLALQDCDVDAALSYVDQPTSDEFLTDEVLERSLELAPISNVSVDPGTLVQAGDITILSAQFDVGNRTITRIFRLKNAYTEPEFMDALVEISLSRLSDSRVIVNGVELEQTTTVSLFPGAYELAFSSDAFAIGSELSTEDTPENVVPGSDNEVFVFASNPDVRSFYEARLILTEKGTQTFRDLVRNGLEQCLGMSTVTTPCGLDASDITTEGAVPIGGTVKRTLTSQGTTALKSLKPTSDLYPFTTFTSKESVKVDITAEADKSGRRTRIESLSTTPLTPYVNFSEDTPSLTWK